MGQLCRSGFVLRRMTVYMKTKKAPLLRGFFIVNSNLIHGLKTLAADSIWR